ncbi:hypothetical protein CKO28_06460 [Rhodovibrio sodomensis]|uniref:Transcriptional regulator n=1 Tax=Rhodovibrio sodomensis TaxID=1088 RepID=A0ABS1DBB1_9PROT|nr:hypothetical protein [Rhodovibrio sodomensis]MBK1667675.1 hypothetical protein [Rhodovibrio sodomensis]
MAGYRIDDAGRRLGRADVTTESHLHAPGPGSGPCLAIMAIAKDFQDLIRAECPHCRTGGGGCLVELMRTAAHD